MELRNLKTFIKVAEQNSFSKAALQLGYAQSTVTAQIEALERELETPLFIRNGKRITISAAGKELLQYAYRAQGLEEEILDTFRNQDTPKGTVHLGILESISVSDYMTAVEHFLQHYPHVRLKITIGTTLQLMDMLQKGDIDLVFLFDFPVSNSSFTTLYQKPKDVLFFGPAKGGIPAATAPSGSSVPADESLSLNDLLDTPWILTEKGCNYRKALDDELSRRKLQLLDRVEIGSTNTIIDLVSKGLGIAILPVFNLNDAVKTGLVRILPVRDFQITMELQVLASKKRWLSPSLLALAEEIQRVL